MEQTPSIGRIVHFVLPEQSERAGEHRAAVITSGFGGPNVNLTVYLDQSNDLPQDKVDSGEMRNFYFVGRMLARTWSAPYDEDGKPGSWHWPERIESPKPSEPAPAPEPEVAAPVDETPPVA